MRQWVQQQQQRKAVLAAESESDGALWRMKNPASLLTSVYSRSSLYDGYNKTDALCAMWITYILIHSLSGDSIDRC